MSPLRHAPSPPFAEAIEAHDLELRGVRARAFEFAGGSRDPARAMVCIAGMGADGRSFARLRPLAADVFVLPLNMPFETPDRADPLEYAADVVEEFLDHEGLVRPVLLGASFGGAVATLVALRRTDRVRGLVLANAVLARSQIPFAFPGFVDLMEAPEPLARLVAPLAVEIMGGFSLDRDARDEIVRQARHFSTRELKRRLRALLRLDLFPELRRLHRTPTLVVHGNRDLLVPWRRGEWAARAIPDARFELVKGAGHLPYLSHARRFNAVTAGFLREAFDGALTH
jgi:pimeloyl-ACP methyl ester carboxylesterase